MVDSLHLPLYLPLYLPLSPFQVTSKKYKVHNRKDFGYSEL